MRSVARTLVRVVNHRIGVDDHVFLYGNEDPTDMQAWEEGFAKLSETHGIPQKANWIASAWEKRQVHSGKIYASHHEDGWLILLRHDRGDPRRVSAAVNDNQADNVQTETVCRTN